MDDDFRPVMLTSHVFQRAVAFLEITHPAVIVCTQRFFSALPPLLACTPDVFVQARDLPVFTKSPAFVFVFRISVEGLAADMQKVILRLISAETLPFLEHLTMRCSGAWKPSPRVKDEELLAFVRRLPEKRMRTLAISGPTFTPYFDDESFCEHFAFVVRKQQPFLETLHLPSLTSVFFDTKVAPAPQSSFHTQRPSVKDESSDKELVPLFPKLKRLRVDGELRAASSHPLLSFIQPLMMQLHELALPVRGVLADQIRGAFVFPDAPLLEKVNKLLVGSSKLTSVDFSGMPNVVDLGDNFLNGAMNLTGTVDLSPLRNLRVVGDNFMSNCRLVERLVLPPTLRRLGGNSWCFGTAKLRELNFSELTQLERVDSTAFLESSGLVLFDTSPLAGTLKRGYNGAVCEELLAHCPNLQAVDLAGLVGVDAIGNHFLYQCSALREVKNVARGLGQVRTFGTYCFHGCMELDAFPFDELEALERVGNNFFGNCPEMVGGKLNLTKNARLINAPIGGQLVWRLPPHLERETS